MRINNPLTLAAVLMMLFLFGPLAQAQVSSQGIPTNEEALKMLKSVEHMTYNYPIHSAYGAGGEVDILGICKYLKSYDINVMSCSEMPNTGGATAVRMLSGASKYITGQGEGPNGYVTYMAAAFVVPIEVIEVRQHQTLNNTLQVVAKYEVQSTSNVGRSVGLRRGASEVYTMNLIPTSNGWKPDVETRGLKELTVYSASTWGSKALGKFDKTMNSKSFLEALDSQLIGSWKKSTLKETKMKTYWFSDKGEYKHFNAKKDETTEGRFKLGKITTEENGLTSRRIILIPKMGKNRYWNIYWNKNGFAIGNGLTPSEVYVPQNTTLVSGKEMAQAHRDQESNKVNIREKTAQRLTKGYWKSGNGKKAFEFKDGNVISVISPRETLENYTYKFENNGKKVFLVVTDPQGQEVMRKTHSWAHRNLQEIYFGGEKYYKL